MFLLCLFSLITIQGVHASPFKTDKDAPVQFQAKTLTHDEDNQTVTALGDVEFVQGQKILRADKMVYHLDTDTVRAIGNVSLMDEEGSVHFLEYIELKRDMTEGFVQGLLSLLNDGSRFTAVEARREGGTKTTMSEASYTACRVCEANPDPLWQLKADKVIHDQDAQEIKYENARLELLGVPLAWTPVFSHADPKVKRRSGFLRPSGGWNDVVGTFIEGSYYYSIAQDKDLTVAVRPTTRQGVLLQGEWRQRFENGRVEVRGSFAESDRREEDGRIEENRLRGHIAANGLFDIDQNWRAGFDLARASDKGYLRLYDLDEDIILQNDIYAERFDDRDYTRISAVSIQDLRLGLRPEQPEVLPMIEHSMMGAPGGLLGGRWTADVSAVQLQRSASGQDLQRATLDLGWGRSDIDPSTGLVFETQAGISGDAYGIQNNTLAAGGNTETTRAVAYAGTKVSYPLVKRLQHGRLMIEPMVSLQGTTRADNAGSDIPNEDSIGVQVDANNIFAMNRFPGRDRVEDGVRTTAGVNLAQYSDNGNYAKVFVGQSYRFKDNDGLFPSESGLERRVSDFVGNLSIGAGNFLNADYRIQVDGENLSAHRHELRGAMDLGRLDLNTRFIYLDAIAGTGFVEPREQWQMAAGFDVSEYWRLSASSLMDFGAEPGLRRAGLSLAYADECFMFSIDGLRNLINDASGESGTQIFMRIGLRNIGEFQTPEITFGQPEQDVAN